MSTLTIHALEPDVERRIRIKAKKERKSLNQTLKQLLAESVGRSPLPAPDHRGEFEEFSGIWSRKDLEAFEKATADFEKVDEKDWK